MMLGWSFAARMVDEVARLLRAMQKHRYLKEVDHRLHWTVDAALSDVPGFAERARAFEQRLTKEPDIHKGSRDPRLWAPASVEEVIGVLTAFWGPDSASQVRRDKLVALFEENGLPVPDHAPFESDPETPPFPELITLDWLFLPVDELDTERHAGVLSALEDAQEEVAPSEPVFVEGPSFSIVELCEGAPFGILDEDLYLWADGPYAYCDYVFHGVSKAAKLEEPPVGPYDGDDDDDEGESVPARDEPTGGGGEGAGP